MMKLHAHLGRRSRLFVAALFLLGYGEFALHFITTSHSICPEHQDIIEHAHHEAHHRDLAADTAASRARQIAAAAADGFHEDGCCFIDLLKTRVLETASVTTAGVVARAPRIAPVVPEVSSTSSVPLLLLAPSHSPPLV
jgi:hypothetical protein